jgi:biopolymer transport protein ExbB
VSLLLRGGWPMIPLLVCSLVAVAVVIERLMILIPLRRRTCELADRIDGLLRDGGVDKVEPLCRESDLPLARVLASGWRRAGRTPEAFSAAIQEAAAVEAPPLQARLWLLGTIAQVSTLLGLLGTVVGMVRAFHSVEARGLAGHLVGAGDLAGGLWISLLATAAGLSVAVPSYFAYYALSSLVNALIARMERCAHGVGEALCGRRRVPPPAPALMRPEASEGLS